MTTSDVDVYALPNMIFFTYSYEDQISPPRVRYPYTIGRDSFAKISAVDGIALSHETEEDFREFELRGLSPEQRRKALIRKYGRKHQSLYT